MAERGQIPKEDAAEIRKRARFSIPEILEIEKRTNHDVIAFLENVAASVGPAARWIHQGLTSSDILDTTLAVQLTEAARISGDGSEGAARRGRESGAQIQNDADDRAQSRHSRRADHVRTEARIDVSTNLGARRNGLRKRRSAFASENSAARSARMRILIRRSNALFARSSD